jgi:hypothetical protein
MTENEYILATDLTRLRFAEALIRDCMKESFYGDEKAVLVNILHDTCERLTEEIETE